MSEKDNQQMQQNVNENLNTSASNMNPNNNNYNQTNNAETNIPVNNNLENGNKMPKNKKQKVKRKGGCLSFFMGMCTAFFLIIFCIGGFGAYVYFCVTFDQLAKTFGVESPLGDEFNNKTVNELIANVLKVKDDYVNMTFNQAADYGLKLPETIIGISLGSVYEKQVQFKDTTTTVGDIEILDAVNNLDEFVDAVVPAVYDSATIGQVLDALQVDITEYGYPAVTDAIYNIGTVDNPVMKSLRELTISQALDVLPTMYSSENLTLQVLQTALGAEYVPNTAEYQTLLSTPITQINLEELGNGLKVGALLDLFGDNALGLNDYKFTQTTEFRETKINELGEYMKTLAVNEIIDITPIDQIENPTTMDRLLSSIGNVTVQEILDGGKSAFANIMDKTTLGYLIAETQGIMPIINNVTLSDILLTPEIIKDMLIAEQRTISDILPNWNYADALLSPIENITFATIFNNTELYSEQLENITFGNLVAGSMNGNMLATETNGIMALLCEITLNEIFFEPQNISSTLCASEQTFGTIVGLIEPNDNSTQLEKDLWTIKDETFSSLKNGYNALNEALDNIKISDLTGSTAGIMKIIGNISLGQIFNEPNVLDNTLKNSTVTLGQMLEINTASGIMGVIADVEVGNLFNGNANSAIKNAFMADENLTLADLLEIETSSTTGIMALIENVKVAGLFGDNPGAALKNAFTSSTLNLGELLEIQNASGILSIISTVQVADLFGEKPADAITNVLKSSNETLGTLLNISTGTGSSGIMKAIANITVGELFTDASNVFNNLTVQDLFPDYENNIILNAIVNKGTAEAPVTISNLENAINQLTLADIVGNNPTGFVALLNLDTKITDLGTYLAGFSLLNQSLIALEDAEIFGENSPFKDTVFDKDSTVLIGDTGKNAYQNYVDTNGSEPDVTLANFISAMTTTDSGKAFIAEFIAQYTTGS